jgi:hypothetical protein
MAEQAWFALETANRPERLFNYAGLPVRILEENTLQAMTPDVLAYEVNRAADFVKLGTGRFEGKRNKAKVPRDLITDMLSHPEIPLPKLDGVRSAPCFSFDGTLIAEKGYHPNARVYLTRFSPLPDLPSITEAIALIDEMLCDIPFESSADRANTFAMIITPFVRNMIRGPVPMTGVTAGSPGVGKGLVSEICLSIGFGENQIVILTPPTDENELRKTITTLLMRGCPALLFDNVESVKGSVISSLLTASTWHDRILGRNSDFTAPVRWMVAFNGNNVAMTTEVARRVIHIRLRVPQDRPWTRTDFKYPDLKMWVLANLPKLQAACVTIIQDWLDKGRPSGTGVQMGSFEQYVKILSGILTNAGIAGFLSNRDELFEFADTEGQAWRTLIAQWVEKLELGLWEKNVTTQALFEIAQKIEGFAFDGIGEKAQKVSFGKALSKKNDTVFGDYRIKKGTVKNGYSSWKLERQVREVRISEGSLFREDYKKDCQTEEAIQDIHLHSLSPPIVGTETDIF